MRSGSCDGRCPHAFQIGAGRALNGHQHLLAPKRCGEMAHGNSGGLATRAMAGGPPDGIPVLQQLTERFCILLPGVSWMSAQLDVDPDHRPVDINPIVPNAPIAILPAALG